jgi:hypothetical protein
MECADEAFVAGNSMDKLRRVQARMKLDQVPSFKDIIHNLGMTQTPRRVIGAIRMLDQEERYAFSKCYDNPAPIEHVFYTEDIAPILSRALCIASIPGSPEQIRDKTSLPRDFDDTVEALYFRMNNESSRGKYLAVVAFTWDKGLVQWFVENSVRE